MTQTHLEEPYMQMCRKSGGYKIHPEKNIGECIQDPTLHNPLPHLYNLLFLMKNIAVLLLHVPSRCNSILKNCDRWMGKRSVLWTRVG